MARWAGAAEYRFYSDLAVWWPLISPPRDYTEEAGYFARVLRTASIPVREVLELGSGGGHNAVHLKASFAMALVDLSAEMLEVSRELTLSATTIRATCALCASAAVSTPCSSMTQWIT